MRTLLLGLAAVLAAAGSTAAMASDATFGAPPVGLAEKLEQLRLAYPNTVAGAQGNDLVLSDGTRLAISDGRTDKSFEELLNSPDVDDMFAFAYPAGAAPAAPARHFDPGRVRVEALFRALYGDCRKGALAGTRKIAWVPKHGGGSVTFTTAQGADKALEAVSEELDRLPASFTKYLAPSAGTYNCRAIAGTQRMSMHAYAAAIDINTKQTTYWQRVKPGADGLYHWSNKIPPEIVAAFEKHGFIWGGRWYHFDTMHFEYRPELLPRRD
jgi:D-alanyl-D-alanine carboxypeptidase